MDECPQHSILAVNFPPKREEAPADPVQEPVVEQAPVVDEAPVTEQAPVVEQAPDNSVEQKSAE